ncbi:hypothetical protein CASFOL_032270 [Castilleja foliolosa]|uniref:Late embryogenesis abundant protein LEA-2 subgroup domain-containing protein n=1 Tax=Castilleja foliolosa TaxID=1961234 RepID=A0ABD3C2B9_9LAMI
MGALSDSDQPIDPKQKTEIHYGYPQEQYTNNYPTYQPTQGYPIPKYHQPDDIINNFHNYPPIPGQQPYLQPYPAYYNYNPNQQTLLPDPGSSSSSFNRIMLMLMIFLIGCMCMMALVTWFLYGTYIPEFEVSSLKVSNFSATEKSLTGTWDVGLAVENTNHDVTIGFRNVRSVILYKGNILGFSATPGFEIEKKGKFDLNVSVPAGENKMNVDNLLMPTLEQDWKNGVAVFSLRLAMSANFSSAERGYNREESLTVSCDDMMVDSSPGVSEGRLSKGVGSPCLISL